MTLRGHLAMVGIQREQRAHQELELPAGKTVSQDLINLDSMQYETCNTAESWEFGFGWNDPIKSC